MRTSLVIGGAGGIGAAICTALAAGGSRVVVADLDVDAAGALAADIGGIGLEIDVTEPESVAAAVAAVAPVSILVNAAGWDRMLRFVDTDETFQQRVIDINLHGPMRVTREVLPGMISRGWGRVVSVSSDAGRVGSSGEAIYAGAKGGVIAFMKTVAREHARHGITANTVCPGPADTPLLRSMVEDGNEGLVEALQRAIPMRRLATPEDIGPLVAFLCSEDAGYITGQTISVSGGLTMV